MGSKLTKSKKKTSEDGKTENAAAPVETDWSTSTWPRKKKPDFSDQKSGTLGRKSRFGKGSTATLGNESKLERRPSFGKRIRASARNWASTRGLYKGPKAQPGNESESKPSNDISKNEIEGNKEKVVVNYAVEEQAVADNKELDVGALVKEMVTESIIKKKLSDTSSQKVEAQIEDDGDKEDYEPVFVSHTDTGVVMSEVCNVEFEPTQLVETCDVVVTEVDTSVERIIDEGDVRDKEDMPINDISTALSEMSLTDICTAPSEKVDNNEIPEISINDHPQISVDVQDVAVFKHDNILEDDTKDEVEAEVTNKTVEDIRETSIDEDICVAVEGKDESLKIEGHTEILAENISQISSNNMEEADQNASEGVEIKIEELSDISVALEEVEKATQSEIQTSAHVVESKIENLNESFVVLEEVETEAEIVSDLVEDHPNSTNTTKVSSGNEMNIPVLSEMEPHLEDLLSKRRNIIEENVPSEDLEREHKQSEIVLEPQLEDLMLKRQNIIDENLPSDDLERESKPSEVILEPELEDLMLKRQNIIEENLPFEDIEKEEKSSDIILEPELEGLMAKRRNIIEENATHIELEKEKKTSEIVLEPELDDLLAKRRNIIDENQVSQAIAEIEDEVANPDQKLSEFIEETGIEQINTEESMGFNSKDEICGEAEQLFDENIVKNVFTEVQNDTADIDFDENEEANLENKEDQQKCEIDSVDELKDEDIKIDVDENEELNLNNQQDEADCIIEELVDDILSENINSIEEATDDPMVVKLPAMCSESCAPYYHGKVQDKEENIGEEEHLIVVDEKENEDNNTDEVTDLPMMCNSSCAPKFHQHISNEETNTEEEAIKEETTDEDHNEESTDVVNEDILTNASQTATEMCSEQCAPAYHKSAPEDNNNDEDNEVDISRDLDNHESVMQPPNMMCTQECAPNFHSSLKKEDVESEKEKDCTSDEVPIQNGINDDIIKNEEDELLEQKIKDLSGIIGDTLKLVQEQISETGDEIDEIEKSKIIDSDYSVTADADNHNDVSEDGSDGERTDISTDEGIVASSDEEEMCKDAKQEKEKLNKNSEEITNSVD